ncbi:ABC transporter permease [Desulfobaculum bizertense]|uniref:ABC-type transport system, involved in lipoprotein release, permease component n=1 Tax=Desulfobaculum bizertense DSM 18034 TaxID=1121442 RepID=A0A1T4W932_9BACT|nr:FtsX-like permease family protein [Desulfobaculum bizertense]SKA73782.1 ABC-type transport system, involved in lipoprotein release, permease component [Desulfobaculum bizertense DSM 18034]
MEILMAWRNIWRHPRRTILTLLAIAFACMLLVFMLSFQFGTYEAMITSVVKSQTGHLQILVNGYNSDHKMRKVVRNPKELEAQLRALPHIKNSTVRANGFSLLSSEKRTYGGLVTGIDPIREAQLSTIASTIREGEYLSPDDSTQALVGALLAKNLHIHLGDELVVLGNARDGSIAATVLTVKGIFRSGVDEYDRSAVQIPLAAFQDIFVMRGAVHQIVIECDALAHVRETQAAITTLLPKDKPQRQLVCMTWSELIPGLIQSIQMDLGGGIIFYLILIIVVAFSIMNTFIMAVFERTHEFGTLIAIGAKPGRLSKMLLYESAMLTICGVLLGIGLGCAVTIFAAHTGIPLGEAEGLLRQYGIPSVIRPQLSVLSATAGPTIVFIITMMTALYPAIKVRSLNPVEAMRAA